VIRRLAVGTLRRAKLEAVRLALDRLVAAGWTDAAGYEIVPVDVPSGVSAMPMSETEGVRGARLRAQAALAATGADVALGLEGGAVVVDCDPPLVLLRNWAAASDGHRTWVGSGPGIMLPEALARSLLDGAELGVVIDRFAGGRDIRSGRGAFGVLTADHIDRAAAFADAVITALAPWYNPDLRWSDEPA
jgi:inosine/xanthosine triphosphatase